MESLILNGATIPSETIILCTTWGIFSLLYKMWIKLHIAKKEIGQRAEPFLNRFGLSVLLTGLFYNKLDLGLFSTKNALMVIFLFGTLLLVMLALKLANKISALLIVVALLLIFIGVLTYQGTINIQDIATGLKWLIKKE